MFNMCMIVHVQYVNTQTHCSSTNYHESIRKWPHICTIMYIHVSVRTNYIQVANYFNDIAINILLLSPSSSCYEPFTSEWLLIALIRAICMRRLHVHAEKSEECMWRRERRRTYKENPSNCKSMRHLIHRFGIRPTKRHEGNRWKREYNRWWESGVTERTPRAGNQSNRQITKRIKTNETRRHSRSSQTCLFLQVRTSMPESKQANSMKVTTAMALKG